MLRCFQCDCVGNRDHPGGGDQARPRNVGSHLLLIASEPGLNAGVGKSADEDDGGQGLARVRIGRIVEIHRQGTGIGLAIFDVTPNRHGIHARDLIDHGLPGDWMSCLVAHAFLQKCKSRRASPATTACQSARPLGTWSRAVVRMTRFAPLHAHLLARVSSHAHATNSGPLAAARRQRLKLLDCTSLPQWIATTIACFTSSDRHSALSASTGSTDAARRAGRGTAPQW